MYSLNMPKRSAQMERTIEIAKRLGLLQRIPLNRSPKVRAGLYEEDYSYLLILDFESTCWKDKSAAHPPEIIEFPVVLLDLGSGEIVAEFHEYVMPTEHPRLTPFCTELTGISQEMVDGGVPLKTCLYLFQNWMKKTKRAFNLTLEKVGTDPCGLYICCTWSDWDLNLCLENECKRKQLIKPEELRSWIDIRAVYRNFYQRKPQGLNGALRDLGVEFEGREHSGIEDARNTAKLVWKMVQDGCKLTRQGVGGEEVIPQSPENLPRNRLNLVKNNPLKLIAETDTPTSSRNVKKRYYGNKIYSKESLANVKIQAPL